MPDIVAVPALQDNYIWLLHDPDGGATIVVDPSADRPALESAETRGWAISQILNTHWHPDHTGGNAGIKAATGAPITAPAEARKVSQVDRVVGEGDRINVGPWEAEVWEIPCHTAGHVAYYLKDLGIVFTGDTLFAMGCGRLFEGTAEQMFANLQRLASLPDETKVYCGHEYTLANARFAITAEPNNAAIADRLKRVEAMREDNQVTLPTTIGEERATNPFMRAANAEEFARLRAIKDSFG